MPLFSLSRHTVHTLHRHTYRLRDNALRPINSASGCPSKASGQYHLRARKALHQQTKHANRCRASAALWWYAVEGLAVGLAVGLLLRRSSKEL